MAFKVAKDCDGVIANSLVPVCREANRVLRQCDYNFSYKPSDFNRFNFLREDVFKRTGDEKLATYLDSLWHEGVVLRQARPFPGMVLVSRITRALDGEEYVVTIRLPKHRRSTLDWFMEYIPPIAFKDRLRIRRHDDLRDGDRYKFDNLVELQPVVYFEDNPGTVRYLLHPERREWIKNTKVCLVNQRMNERDSDLDKYRVHGVLGILVATLTAKSIRG